MCGRDLSDCDTVVQFLERTYTRKLWEKKSCIFCILTKHLKLTNLFVMLDCTSHYYIILQHIQ